MLFALTCPDSFPPLLLQKKTFCAKTLTTFAQAKRVDREGIEENGGWWTRRLVVLGPCLFLSPGDRSKTFDT